MKSTESKLIGFIGLELREQLALSCGETEVQRGAATCPKSQRKLQTEPELGHSSESEPVAFLVTQVVSASFSSVTGNLTPTTKA